MNTPLVYCWQYQKCFFAWDTGGSMKHMLIAGMTGGVGGMESFVMNYYRHGLCSGFHVDFLVYTPHMAYEEEVLASGSRVFHLTARSTNLFRNFRERQAFFQEHASRYAVIWSQQCDLTNIDTLRCARRYGIPRRIIHSHSIGDLHKPLVRPLTSLLHRWHRRQIARYATDFWACSPEAGRFFYPENVRHSPACRIIPNAIDASAYRFCARTRQAQRQALGLEQAFVVGCVGRLQEEKNPRFLLEAFAVLHRRRPDAVLLLVGDGVEREALVRRAADLGLTDAVRFLGIRTDVPALMQAMDVFAMPSRFEGLGIAAVEAQAADLPCVLADGIPAAVGLTERARFLPLRAGADAWGQALWEAGDAAARRDRCQDIARAGYDIQENARLLRDVYLA